MHGAGRSRTGFGRAPGRRSRANAAHTGGHESARQAKQVAKDAPEGQCWGCYYRRWAPWEHDMSCPRWQVREGEFSGC